MKTLNDAGGLAFSNTKKAALAQLVSVGTFRDGFYLKDEEQFKNLKDILDSLLNKPNGTEFVAKCCIYSYEYGKMKEMPAFLAAWLSIHDLENFKIVFKRVINNGKMIHNFVKYMRSGIVGRKSLGTVPKDCVKNWIGEQSTLTLLNASVGTSPSLADIIRMVHPKAKTEQENELFRFILGFDYDINKLPQQVQQLIAFRKGEIETAPPVRMELFTGNKLTQNQWVELAKNISWNGLRQNLNTFERQGVFKDEENEKLLANKLNNSEMVEKYNIFPYQLYSTWANIHNRTFKNVLEKLIEISLKNVPNFKGKKLALFSDVSSSMLSPITGHKQGSSSSISCGEVAGLFLTSLKVANPDAIVKLFNTKIIHCSDILSENVFETIKNIKKTLNGGTSCHVCFDYLLKKKEVVDYIIMMSDNESWFIKNSNYGSNKVLTKSLWEKYKEKINPNAKLICIDLIPNTTIQVKNDPDVLNIGGFSESIFDVIKQFLEEEVKDWVSFIDGTIVLT